MKCDTPITVKTKKPMADGTFKADVPCGRCPGCRQKRIAHWVFRLLQEDKVSLCSHFVTLTYDTDHVPITNNGFPTLKKSDYQLFMKRLRKHFPDHKLKYYVVGEYGTKTRRPHYHAIIFNVTDTAKIQEEWTLGAVHIGDVKGASIAYTAKYIHKESSVPLHSRDDRLKEFSLMSKGLGKNYMTPQIVKYHKADLYRNYLTLEDGIKIPLPRYYREKILNPDEIVRQRQLILREMRNEDAISEEEYYRQNPDGDYDRFKESAKRARYKSFYHFTQNQRDL